MNILIYGGKGWIGSQFCQVLDAMKIKYIISESRVNNKKDVEEEIIKTKPTNIISFIGRTSGGKYTTIDYLEDQLNENVRDNLFSPMVLAILSTKYKIHFTYLGTGCIFDYPKEDGKYKFEGKIDDEERPNFFGSAYSTVKGYTDELMHMYDILNIRIRMPISSIPHPRNFITKITTYEKICSIPNSMTVLDNLFPTLINLIKTNVTGTFNFTNPGVISHNEILEMYKEIVDEDFTWVNFSVEEQNTVLKSKRSNNHLDTSKLESIQKIDNIKDATKECLNNYLLNL